MYQMRNGFHQGFNQYLESEFYDIFCADLSQFTVFSLLFLRCRPIA